MSARQPDAETLLRTEHAVARVLTDAPDEGAAFSRILEAIGSSLQWDTGALWQLDRTALKRIAAWNTPEPFDAAWLHAGEGLPGAVYTSGGPAWIADVQADQHQPRGASAIQAGLHAAFAFPITGTSGVLGVIEFLAKEQREPDDALLATMTSLGGRIGQAVERWRSEARKTAILDAAFDAIITMDAAGDIVEVNRATEKMFGYRAEDMVGRDLAELIIPPALREPHRHGLDRYLRTGRGRMVDHPLELPAMRADGSEFPAEIGITRPQLGGPPVFTGYIRDITQRRSDEQELRDLAAEQAALRRVAVVVAGEHDPQRVFAVATEEVARLLGAATSNMVRFEDDGTATVEGAWSAPGTQAVPTGTKLALDSPTAAARIRATGRPARVDGLQHHARDGRRPAAPLPLHRRDRSADRAVREALGRGDGLDHRAGAVPARRRAADRRLRRAGGAQHSPTPRRGRSSRRRAPGSSRPATTSAAGSSATSTTARSSGSSRWR